MMKNELKMNVFKEDIDEIITIERVNLFFKAKWKETGEFLYYQGAGFTTEYRAYMWIAENWTEFKAEYDTEIDRIILGEN